MGSDRLEIDSCFRIGKPGSSLFEFTVGDFWCWAFSDLKNNVVRGALAEFIVAKALGVEQPTRQIWDAFDLQDETGTRIEVKASAYLQSWHQARLSTISFGGLRSRSWSPEQGYSEDSDYHADVYVFCVQTARRHQEYDSLDQSQWDFYVVPRARLVEHGTASISYSSVLKLAPEPVDFDDLKEAVRQAGAYRRMHGQP